MTNNGIMRSILNASIYLITAMLAVIMFTLGPRLEVVINPVVGAFEIRNSYFNDGYFIEGAMLKTRSECEPTGIYMYADGGFKDDNAKTIGLNFDNDPAHVGPGLTSRPKGAQYWGPWEITPPEEPVGPIFTIVATHRCHALWELTQVIYTGLTTEIFPDLLIDQE